VSSFAPKADYATGQYPISVAVGDFNLDSTPDLVVANSYADTISVLLGNGDGTFASKVDYGTGAYSMSVAVGDFNLDGKPDLAVTDYWSVGVSVLLGNGDGTFAPRQRFVTDVDAYSVAVADFNLDGKPDLAVANASNTVSVLMGNGDGTFASGVEYGTRERPTSIAVGDFNLDGNPDVVVADEYPSMLSVLLGTCQGAPAACSQRYVLCTLDSDCCTPYYCGTDGYGRRACELDCVPLDEEACKNAGCYPIYGVPSVDGGTSTPIFAGCMANGTCVDMQMCAYPPGHPEDCLVFASGCIPSGWQGDMCSMVGCPPGQDAGP
jgi:hypothetical protein